VLESHGPLTKDLRGGGRVEVLVVVTTTTRRTMAMMMAMMIMTMVMMTVMMVNMKKWRHRIDDSDGATHVREGHVGPLGAQAEAEVLLSAGEVPAGRRVTYR
jgi:hypothetical protein